MASYQDGLATGEYQRAELKQQLKEYEAENAKLLSRCRPNTTVLIGDTAHYVNDAVRDHIYGCEALIDRAIAWITGKDLDVESGLNLVHDMRKAREVSDGRR